MRIEAQGITVDLPPQWEGAIFQRPAVEPGPAVTAPAATASRAAAASRGADTDVQAEQFHPVTHLATFPLPRDRGDFGSGAVERMSPDDVFVAVLEYGPECAGTALFQATSLPRFTHANFGPNQLQRVIRGQAGSQAWCTVEGRAFGIYAVLGSANRAAALVPRVNSVLAAVTIRPR